MTDIFLSRPTWVPPEYQEGLNNFLSLLDSLELNPRTIGKTDYPVESPLDEVIEFIEKTSGMIVLGYPQIFIEKGNLKEKTITEQTNLATEWNHIEASLAYAKKLPLLIIHDLNVIRGIFDRGAVNKFVYEKDFKNDSWASSEDINGALKNWKQKIESYSDRDEYYQVNPLKVEPGKDIDITDLTAEAKELLKEATQDDYGQIGNNTSSAGRQINTNGKTLNEEGNPRNESLWKAALEELEDYGLIEPINVNKTFFQVTHDGYKLIPAN